MHGYVNVKLSRSTVTWTSVYHDARSPERQFITMHGHLKVRLLSHIPRQRPVAEPWGYNVSRTPRWRTRRQCKQNNSVCGETRNNFTNHRKRQYVKGLPFVLYHSHGKLYFNHFGRQWSGMTPRLPFNPRSIRTFIRQIKANLLYCTPASEIKIVQAVNEYAWYVNVKLSENNIALFGVV